MECNSVPVEQVRGSTLSSDETLVLAKHLTLVEVHVVLIVSLCVVSQVVVVSPIEVVCLSSLALHHQGMLTDVLIQGSGARFLG